MKAGHLALLALFFFMCVWRAMTKELWESLTLAASLSVMRIQAIQGCKEHWMISNFNQAGDGQANQNAADGRLALGN